MNGEEKQLRARNLRTLAALATLFLAPLLIAFCTYYGSAWRPLARVNHGELIQPPRPLPPGALPQVLVGLRQSLAVAWLALVVAEQFNTNAGLGFMISQGTQFDRNDVIFVALLIYCILGLLTDSLVRLAERRALSWRRSFPTQ